MRVYSILYAILYYYSILYDYIYEHFTSALVGIILEYTLS